ncbi:MAG: hypothetical protein RLZZ577_1641 [Bacteroidota bacterium]|jgi:hypothetical protein
MAWIKKNMMLVLLIVVAYFTKDKWMPLLKGNENKEGGDAKSVEADLGSDFV